MRSKSMWLSNDNDYFRLVSPVGFRAGSDRFSSQIPSFQRQDLTKKAVFVYHLWASCGHLGHLASSANPEPEILVIYKYDSGGTADA